MSIQAVAAEVWTAEHPMHFPGGVHLPSRMTIIRLPDGDLLLHSPIPIDDALAAELSALGPVAHVVAPSLLHHLFVPQALERYPQALLIAAPGLAEKRAELPVADVLSDEPPPAWEGVIDQVVIRGAPRLNEVAMLHRPSRTLIVSDLVFNVQHPQGLGTALALRMMGTHKRLRQSRAWHLYARDRAQVRESVEKVLSWEFDRVLPGHGDPFEGNGNARAAMREAMWVVH